jgi:nucleotide-binding universal stress UspA family protein
LKFGIAGGTGRSAVLEGAEKQSGNALCDHTVHDFLLVEITFKVENQFYRIVKFEKMEVDIMKILIPVESAVMAEAQVDFIINHKWPGDLAFQVLYALEPLIDADNDNDNEPQQAQMSEWNRARGLKLITDVSNMLRKAFHNADILETLETDYASELILDVAEQWDADLILMGAHGRRMPARMTVGSVSTAVLGYADCAVVVVRPAKKNPGEQANKAKSESKSKLVGSSS